MINALNREIPDEVLALGKNGVYQGAFAYRGRGEKTSVKNRTVYPGEKKLVSSLQEAIRLSGLKSGMTISFHHHLRNGDYVVQMVLEEIDKLSIRNLTIAASALFDCHSFLDEYVYKGVIKNIQANYISGRLAEEISFGLMDEPVIMRTHGGRDRAIESGELKIDVAFLATPTADNYGNLNAVEGPSAFGSFGYAISDARYAECVVAITDNLLPYPLSYVAIDQTLVDYVVEVDKIGDTRGIVSGTTRISQNPLDHKVAKLTAIAIENSGYFHDGFSFQTGAGGISLATAIYVHEKMKKLGIKGSFGLGGITEPMVDMLKDDCFSMLLDTQCFDLMAIESLRTNTRHREISCSTYSNPHTKGAVVNLLDVAVLGATEIDLDFNVNVTTNSDGIIIGGAGGHADASAGSNMTMIVANLCRGRFPTIVDKVIAVNTPGETVDVLVTDWGIAVNKRRPELAERFKEAGLPVKDIEHLYHIARKLCGQLEPIKQTDKVIGVIEYRDGTLIDVVRSIR